MERFVAHKDSQHPYCENCKYYQLGYDDKDYCSCAVDLITGGMAYAHTARGQMCGVNGRYFERRNEND